MSSTSRVGPVVKAYVRPYDFWYGPYSAYYRDSLRRYASTTNGLYEEISMSRFPGVMQRLRRVRDSYRLQPFFDKVQSLKGVFDGLASVIEGRVVTPAPAFCGTVAHYLISPKRDDREYNVCVDTSDSGQLQEVYSWADIYFKTNYWPTIAYPENVLPLVNADPLVVPQIEILRGYRSTPKVYDVCFVVRVWGGSDENEGVEHNLRLIEAVAKSKCKKYLYAYLVAGDIEASRMRLERQNIPCGTTPIASSQLWHISAQSRLNIIRLGMYYCIPWRFTGALAIGSTIVLDRAPFTRWPVPLTPREQFLDLGVETGVEQSLAPAEQYAAIPRKIEAWLGDQEALSRIAQNSAEYFDCHVHPKRVGQHIVSSLQCFAAE